MKIVLPVHHFPPRYSAGAELYTYRLARWLLAQGHMVDVISIEAIDTGRSNVLDAKKDIYDGIPVWRLSFDIFSAPDRRRWDFDNPLLGEWFVDYFQQTRPDVAHFQAGYLLGVAPMFAADQTGVPSMLTLHDFWYLCPRHTLQRSDSSLCEAIPEDPGECAWCLSAEDPYVRLADRAILGLMGRLVQRAGLAQQRALMAERRNRMSQALKIPKAVISPSRYLAKRFSNLIEPQRLIVSRYGLDLKAFPTSHLRSLDGKLRLGFLGQVAPHKGVHLLIQAVQILKNKSIQVELHIYGGLEAYPAYVQQLRHLAKGNQNIFFHGHFHHQDLLGILSGLEFTVTPSVWYENCPLSILESYAAHVPVIAVDLGGMTELVNHDTDGLLFKPCSSEDLACQLQRVIDDPLLRERIRSGAVARKSLSIEEEMRTILSIYQAISDKVSDYQTEATVQTTLGAI